MIRLKVWEKRRYTISARKNKHIEAVRPGCEEHDTCGADLPVVGWQTHLLTSLCMKLSRPFGLLGEVISAGDMEPAACGGVSQHKGFCYDQNP